MGALIPGVLFIFSIMMCVVFPICCYTGAPNFPNEDTRGGWFWIVAFFTFLILSYVVGHIFYRSDIKKTDKADIKRQRKQLIKKLKKEINLIKKKLDEYSYPAIKYVAELLISEIEPLYNNLKQPDSKPKQPTKNDNSKKKYDEVYNQNFLNACKTAIENIRKLIDNKDEFITRVTTHKKYDENILIILFPEDCENSKDNKTYCISEETLSPYSKDVLNEYKDLIRKAFIPKIWTRICAGVYKKINDHNKRIFLSM